MLRAVGQHLGMLIGQLVHPKAQRDPAEFSRHRAFIAAHLAGGLIALCFLPVFLALYGQPRLIEALAFVWFISPIAIAMLLSTSGRYELAHLVSTLNLTALIVFGTMFTGGINSFLLPWLIIVPIEAALSRSRHIIMASSSLACIGVLGVLALQNAGHIERLQVAIGQPVLYMALGVGFAIAYAGSLSLSVHSVYRGQENRVQQQNQRFAQLLQGSGSLVTWHAADGAVREVSGIADGLFEGQPGALLGDGMLDCVHVADRPAFLTAISRAAQQHMTTRVEYRLAAADRATRTGAPQYAWVETSCIAVDDPAAVKAGRNPGVMAVTRTIQSYKEREFSLIGAKAEAEANAAAKSGFIAGLGHELRSPLNAMLGFSELLAGDSGVQFSAEQQRDYARLIHASGKSLLHFIDEISALAQIEAGTFNVEQEEVDLAEVLADALGQVRVAARERAIAISHDFGRTSCIMHADRAALVKAFGHVLDNAVKYCASGGKIAMQLVERDGVALVSVSDTGSGIERAALPLVTRAFYSSDGRASRSRKGAGIGLAFAKGIAELHRGSLEIDSELGGGTCVTIRLPLERAQQAPAGRVQSPALATRLRRTA